MSAPLEARDVRPRDRKAARSVDPGSHTAKNQTLDKSSARERAHARDGRVRATYLDILVGPLAEELDLSRSDRHSFRWSVRALVIRGLKGCAFPLFVSLLFVQKVELHSNSYGQTERKGLKITRKTRCG